MYERGVKLETVRLRLEEEVVAAVCHSSEHSCSRECRKRVSRETRTQIDDAVVSDTGRFRNVSIVVTMTRNQSVWMREPLVGMVVRVRNAAAKSYPADDD